MEIELKDFLNETKLEVANIFAALGLGKINEKIDSSVKDAIKETKGKIGVMSSINTLGIISPKKILVAGLGPKNKLTTDVVRSVTGKILTIQDFELFEQFSP